MSIDDSVEDPRMYSSSPQSSAALARQVRLNVLHMTSRGNSSHVGSGFSCADIIAVLYADILKVRPLEPDWIGRDRFVLSKGHAGAVVYAVLALRGFFPLEWLEQHYQNGSRLSGHVSHKGIPGVEMSTGSLGHGLSVAAGMAYGARLNGGDWLTYCLLSDGECDEGSTWEAILFSAHHKLNNLVAVVDYNGIQSLGTVAETLALEPFADKWRAFGWDVIEVDGHDHAELRSCLRPSGSTRPLVIIAHTTKGKGVSFMENSVLWHYRSPQGQEYEDALEELRLKVKGPEA
jgi:transketolase